MPQIEVERLTGEFLSLVQTTDEITDKLLERSLFCPERMKMYRYVEVLKPEIREFVVMARCIDFHQMHEMVWDRELELERQGKRKKVEQAQTPTHQAKKFKLAGQKSKTRRDLLNVQSEGSRIPVSVDWVSGCATSVGSRVISAEIVKWS